MYERYLGLRLQVRNKLYSMPFSFGGKLGNGLEVFILCGL